jgi:hypothetical protein
MRRFFVDDLWVRFGYGLAAVDIIKEQPISGVGIGAFPIVAPEYIYRQSGREVAADNAQNWWRHQIAELGLVGAIPALWASVLVLSMMRGGAVGAPRGAAVVLRGSLIGLGIASLLGVPTQHPATAVAVATLIFWLHGLLHDGPHTGPPPTPAWWTAAFVVAVVVSVSLAIGADGSFQPRTRAVQSGSAYAHGFSHSEGISAYGDFRWAATDAVTVTRVMNRWLQLTLWAPYPNVADRNITARVRVNGREVLAHRFTTAEAETFFVAMPFQDRWVTLELEVDGAVPSQRAIQTGVLWRAAPPANAPPERIVQ